MKKGGGWKDKGADELEGLEFFKEALALKSSWKYNLFCDKSLSLIIPSSLGMALLQ
jgi:hypothetical protein